MSTDNYAQLAFDNTCRIIELFFGVYNLDENQYEVRQMHTESIIIILTGEEANNLIESTVKFSAAIQHIVRKSIYETLKVKKPLFIQCERNLNFKNSFEQLNHQLAQRPPSPRLNQAPVVQRDKPTKRLSSHRQQRNDWQINLPKSHLKSLPHHQMQQPREDSPKASKGESRTAPKASKGESRTAPKADYKNQKPKRFKTPWKKKSLLEKEQQSKKSFEDSKMFMIAKKGVSHESQ